MLIKLRLGMTDKSTNEPNETTARSMGDTIIAGLKLSFNILFIRKYDTTFNALAGI